MVVALVLLRKQAKATQPSREEEPSSRQSLSWTVGKVPLARTGDEFCFPNWKGQIDAIHDFVRQKFPEWFFDSRPVAAAVGLGDCITGRRARGAGRIPPLVARTCCQPEEVRNKSGSSCFASDGNGVCVRMWLLLTGSLF